MLTERRRTRSSRRSEALHFLLHGMRKRLRVRAITLGTVSGALLVGAGDDPERVAELGAHIDAGKTGGERAATWRLRVGPTEFLLTSLGGAMDADLGAGVRRIISTTSV
jgi:hypothetical protein